MERHGVFNIKEKIVEAKRKEHVKNTKNYINQDLGYK